MKKNIVLLFLFLGATTFPAMAVYESGKALYNSHANLINTAKNAVETTQMRITQALQLQNDLTNLENWGGMLLGEENAQLAKTLKDLQAIHDGSKSIIRDSAKFEQNFDRTFQNFENYKNMDNMQLLREVENMSGQVNTTIKDSLKLASKTAGNIASETKSLAFMGKTDGAKGNLQIAIANKKIAEMQNNKLARIENLTAENLRVLALTQQAKITQEEIDNEDFKNWIKTEKTDTPRTIPRRNY
jgi:P-type conjugative transfer protein TrbJ